MGPLNEVLSGHLGVGAVRDVVLHPRQHGLSGLGPGGPSEGDGGLELLRSKFKPARKLSAYYRRAPVDGAPAQYLAVSWQPGAAGGGTAAVAVLTSPDDPAMPQLARLTNPDYLASLAARFGAGPAKTVRGTRQRRLEVTPLRYRPGQRHVLRVRGGQGSPGFIVKTDKEGSGQRATEVAAHLGPLLAQRCPGARVAQPMGFSPEDSAALWRLAPGSALSHLLGGSERDAAAYVALVGGAARVLHDRALAAVGASLADGLPGHDVATEVRSTLRAGEHLHALVPALGREFDGVAAAVEHALQGCSEAALSFLHGDLKSDNLLVHDGSVRVLDLDRVCRGDAALDLAKFWADLRWWSGSDEEAQRLRAALRAGYGPGADDRWARAVVLAALFELKFAARRCAVHDPQWESRVRAQVELAQSTLSSAARPW
jgi:hypothetical protein